MARTELLVTWLETVSMKSSAPSIQVAPGAPRGAICSGCAGRRRVAPGRSFFDRRPFVAYIELGRSSGPASRGRKQADNSELHWRRYARGQAGRNGCPPRLLSLLPMATLPASQQRQKEPMRKISERVGGFLIVALLLLWSPAAATAQLAHRAAAGPAAIGQPATAHRSDRWLPAPRQPTRSRWPLGRSA